MDSIILYRNTQTGRVGFVANEDGEMAVFPHFDDALNAAGNTTVCLAFPFQIVELDEL